MLCNQIEDYQLRTLCIEISSDTSSVAVDVNNNTNNRAQEVKNMLGIVQGNLYNSIISNANNILNQVNSTRSKVQSNVTSQGDSTRNLITNVTQQIKDLLNGRTNGISEFLQSVQQNILTRVNQDIQEGQAQTDLVQKTILQSAAETALEITTRVNQATEPIRYAINDVSSRITETVDTIETQIGNVFDRIVAAIKAIIDGLKNEISLWWSNLVNSLTNRINDNLSQMKGDLLDIVQYIQHLLDLAKNGSVRELNDLFQNVFNADNQTNNLKIALVILLFLPNVFNISHAAFQPWLNIIQQSVNVLEPTALLDAETLIRGLWKGTVDADLAAQHMAKAGYSRDSIVTLLETYKQLFGVDTLRELYHRKLISLDTLQERLSWLGYGDLEINLISSTLNVLPPIQDVIRFAVREAFSPEVVREFGLDQSIPDGFIEQASLRGLDNENAKYYWRAHWELPSLTNGFQMFHRGIITEDQLKLLLRTHDVMPFWADRLIKLSYDLPTRVDIRRMFNIGVINRNQVKEFYKQSGYDEATAEGLTKFTEIEYAPEDGTAETSIKLATRSVIEKAYIRGLMTYDDAIKALTELQYSEETAALLLDLADYSSTVANYEDLKDDFDIRIRNITIQLYTRRTLSRDDALLKLDDLGFTETEANNLLDIADVEYDLGIQDDIIKNVQQMFIERTVDAADITTLLASFGYTNLEIDRIMSSLNVFREIRTRKPTLAQLTNFLKKGIINAEQWYNEVAGLGYADKYIEMYYQQLQIDGSIE